MSEPRISEADREFARQVMVEFGLTSWTSRAIAAERGVTSAVYLLVQCGEVVYVGQSGDLWTRLDWHRTYCRHRFDDVRILPLPNDRRVRTLVEHHVRDLLGCDGGTSVRDRVEMTRDGAPVDPVALAWTGPAIAATTFLRWVLS